MFIICSFLLITISIFIVFTASMKDLIVLVSSNFVSISDGPKIDHF